MVNDDGPFGRAGLATFLLKWLYLISPRWGSPLRLRRTAQPVRILASWGEVLPGPWMVAPFFLEDFSDLVLFYTSVVDPKLANAL